MAREWSELLQLRGEPAAPEHDAEAATEERRGFFRRLRESLRATREALGGELSASFAQTLEAQDWEALEEALIMADVGASTTAAVVGALETVARTERLGGEALRDRLASLLAETARGGEGAADAQIDLRPLPTVVLMVGVNGTSTTSWPSARARATASNATAPGSARGSPVTISQPARSAHPSSCSVAAAR